MNSFTKALKNYAVFTGRSSRSDFWLYALFVVISAFIASTIDAQVFGVEGGLGPLSIIFSLGTFLPSLAVAIRRLHDTDRSGWWYLILLVPLVGAVVLLVFFCTDSTSGPNRFGPNPKPFGGTVTGAADMATAHPADNPALD
jgi:uncharacterized membrane protein YhaH (DUF805 family)